jgi:hypothetical protein
MVEYLLKQNTIEPWMEKDFALIEYLVGFYSGRNFRRYLSLSETSTPHRAMERGEKHERPCRAGAKALSTVSGGSAACCALPTLFFPSAAPTGQA